VIADVGPGGNFMTQRHTKRHFRDEWFFPTLFNRRGYQEWEDGGKPDLAAKAQAKLLGIIEDHQPPQLDAETRQRVHAVVQSLQ
jgi:trimethylamine--corrinoid protein Co-methyltransferase